jgi:cAMP-binding proteins - catabolite gene activator and regulatory subunit of cAMP-dependent protein kinases
MKKIVKPLMINEYIQEYNIDSFFNNNISNYVELLLFKKGEHICIEGEPIDYLLFFIKGKAKIYTTLKNGRNTLVCFYNPFKLIGELEIIISEPAISSIQVVEDSFCLGIPIKIVNENLITDIKFIRLVSESLGEKLKKLSKNSSINLNYPLENRIASFIIASRNTLKRNGKEILIFNENLTEVAELLGTSYRHLLRSLKALCEKKIIIKNEMHYEVLDYDKLLAISSDLYRQ